MRYIGDPVAVVAAETREQALAAAAAVMVDYEPLPVVGSPQEAMADGAPQIHAEWSNVCLTQPQIKGDAAKALRRGGRDVVEAHFVTQCNHQASLEPEVSLAYFEGEGDDAELVVVGRSINIHKHLAMLQEATGWENMRYEEAFVGGQFGIKIDVTSEGLTAAAAIHFRRPVRYIPSLQESMYLSPKRHPFDMKLKLAADADGRLTALGMDILVDNGAYNSMGNVVMLRAMQMLSGSYDIPNVDALARLVYTNNPWGAAARGAGPPQTHFALESAIDMLARKLDIDPLEFRRRNSLLPGQTKSTGAVVDEWPFPELCDAIKPAYERAVAEAREQSTAAKRRGVGLGAGAFGIGGPGDQSMVAIELDPDDGVTVYGAVADPGEGNDSMLLQLTADALDLPLHKVRLQTRSTENTTANGPAAASRHTYMSGGSLLDGIAQLKAARAESGATTYAELQAAGAAHALHGHQEDGGRRARPADRPGPVVRVAGARPAARRGRGRHRERRGARDPHDLRGRRRPRHPPAQLRRPDRGRHGHGRGPRAARDLRARRDQGLGDLQVPQHAHRLRHGRSCANRRDRTAVTARWAWAR